jgi:hypothetical protein
MMVNKQNGEENIVVSKNSTNGSNNILNEARTKQPPKGRFFKFSFGGEAIEQYHDDDYNELYKFLFREPLSCDNNNNSDDNDDDSDADCNENFLFEEQRHVKANFDEEEQQQQPQPRRRYYLYIICGGYNNSPPFCKIGYSTADEDTFFDRKNHYWVGSNPRFCFQLVTIFIFSFLNILT